MFIIHTSLAHAASVELMLLLSNLSSHPRFQVRTTSEHGRKLHDPAAIQRFSGGPLHPLSRQGLAREAADEEQELNRTPDTLQTPIRSAEEEEPPAEEEPSLPHRAHVRCHTCARARALGQIDKLRGDGVMKHTVILQMMIHCADRTILSNTRSPPIICEIIISGLLYLLMIPAQFL